MIREVDLSEREYIKKVLWDRFGVTGSLAVALFTGRSISLVNAFGCLRFVGLGNLFKLIAVMTIIGEQLDGIFNLFASLLRRGAEAVSPTNFKWGLIVT